MLYEVITGRGLARRDHGADVGHEGGRLLAGGHAAQGRKGRAGLHAALSLHAGRVLERSYNFV